MGKIRKCKDMDLSMLCHQYALVLKSGIHPMEGIPLISEDTRNPDLKKALGSIAAEVQHGKTLSGAFEETGFFPAYMVAMIRVGEQTGMLESVMEGLSGFYENQSDIKKRIRSAVSYPAILAALMLGVIALIALKVIPMFVDILTSLGGQVPSQVSLFMALGAALQNGFLYAAAGIVLIALVILMFFRIPKFRFFIDRLKLSNPIAGSTYRKITASRFSGALSLTLKNGMSVMEGFGIVSGVLDNEYVVKKANEAAKAVLGGQSFSDSIAETGMFPALFTRLVKTGEKTGNLDVMMEKIAKTYREEVDNALKRVIGYIEPVCVTFLSLILAGVLLSVILPLISIMSSIG